MNLFFQALHCLWTEGVSGIDKGVHVFGPQLPVDDLVELLEDLAKARLVQLDVRLELAQLDIEVDDPLLEHDARGEQGGLLGIVIVVGGAIPARPGQLGRGGHVANGGHHMSRDIGACFPPPQA